jgi:hypothetical protein
MPPFLYRCPNTGDKVQGFAADEGDPDTYQQITCIICQQVHFVNPATGMVLGGGDE